MPEFFDHAHDAWTFLVSHGGLEVDGRDESFVQQLVRNLTAVERNQYLDDDGEAPIPKIDDVLKRVSVEQLVNAMFVSMGLPFIRMMRDLLDHFARTQITEGPAQWKLLLTSETDKLEVDLEDFKKWIQTSQSKIAPLMVPVLKPEMGVWNLMSSFEDEWQNQTHIGFREVIEDTDSADWINTTDSTSWLPLPPVIDRMLERTDQLRATAALVCEVASAIQSIVPNYAGLNGRVSELRDSAPEAIRPYISIEHDRWIESMIRNLAVFEQANIHEQAVILSKLETVLDGVPLEPSEFAHRFEDLTAFLDLPIWKKRYELYSAWLLTQFLAAMDGHSIAYHDEGGRLTFGFHATQFATINSTNPPIQITGERRIAATNLKGHGRKEGIQPDYTVWTTDTDRCLLAIEAKHYKRGSYRNFHDALNDYASNLPDARVMLGSYGPMHILLESETRNGGTSGRQFTWGNLNPDFPKVVASFRGTIRKILGDPTYPRAYTNRIAGPRVLGLDVSPSMHDALRNPSVQKAIAEIVSVSAITHFAAVDDHLIGFEPADVDRIPCFITQSTSAGTNLKPSTISLSAASSELFFLTDAEGLQSLGGSAVELQQYISGFASLRSREITLARITH